MRFFISILALYLPLSISAQKIKPRLVLPVGHTAYVINMQFSPDQQTLLTSSIDGSVKLWSLTEGSLIYSLEENLGRVDIAATFSPDGKLIMVSSGSTTRIWEPATGQTLLVLDGHSKGGSCFSSDSKKLLTWSANEIKQWNLGTGRMLPGSIAGFIKNVTSAAYNTDGTMIIASEYGTGKVEVFHAGTGRLLTDLKDAVTTVPTIEFSKDSKRAIGISDDKTIKIWDIATGNLLFSLGKQNTPTEITKAVFSKDKKRAVSYSYNGTSFSTWNLDAGRQISTGRGAEAMGLIGTLDLDPTSSQLAIGSGDETDIFNVQTGQLISTLSGNKMAAGTIRYSPDGSKLAIATNEGSIKIWDAGNHKLLFELKAHGSAVTFARYSPDGTKVCAAYTENIVRVWEAATGKLICSLTGHSRTIRSLNFSNDGRRIITLSWDSTVKIWDASTGKKMVDISLPKVQIDAAPLSPDGNLIATTSSDGIVRVWNAYSGKLMYENRRNNNYLNWALFSPDGKKLALTNEIGPPSGVDILNAASGELLFSLDGNNNTYKDLQFSPDGTTILSVSMTDTAKMWDVTRGRLLWKHLFCQIRDPITSAFSPDSKYLVTEGWRFTDSNKNAAIIYTDVYDRLTGQLIRRNDEQDFDRIYRIIFSPDGANIILGATTGKIRIRERTTLRLVQSMYLGPDCGLNDINFKDNKILASGIGSLDFFDLQSGKKLQSLIAIDSIDWVCLHESGLFDASTSAMEKMHWAVGTEEINLDQLKSRYWQPGLFEKIMKDEPLRNVSGMDQLALPPQVELGPVINDRLPVILVRRDGGYGQVSVFVNNKEVIEDARPADFDTLQPRQQIDVDLTKFLSDGIPNRVKVISWSANGFIRSHEATTTIQNRGDTSLVRASFYAIVCGTANYSNPGLNLRYPAQDANAFATSLQIGAANLFGPDSTHVLILTSPGPLPTTKDNIKQAFKNISQKARPKDVVLVYLSGHGIAYGGEKGDFYYLTSESSMNNLLDFSDPALRQGQSISTSEFTSWLNEIPALKQVMIIDACGSGRAVENQLVARRDIDPNQRKALDRMKDRTGLSIISGCAADGSSYEASRYGQGILTYALLQSMKGAGLRENRFVDVNEMAQYAREQVPLLAAGIGGIQKPDILSSGGSFDIGIMNEKDRNQIPLASIKPVYTRCILLEESQQKDVLKLSASLNDELIKLSSSETNTPIVYIDANDYPDACTISGLYNTTGNKIDFHGNITCGTQERKVNLKGLTKEALLNALIKMVVD